MKKKYPIVMIQSEKAILVWVPDFKINTRGEDVLDAIEKARKTIQNKGRKLIENGEPLPEATSLTDVQEDAPAGVVITPIEVIFDETGKE